MSGQSVGAEGHWIVFFGESVARSWIGICRLFGGAKDIIGKAFLELSVFTPEPLTDIRIETGASVAFCPCSALAQSAFPLRAGKSPVAGRSVRKVQDWRCANKIAMKLVKVPIPVAGWRPAGSPLRRAGQYAGLTASQLKAPPARLSKTGVVARQQRSPRRTP